MLLPLPQLVVIFSSTRKHGVDHGSLESESRVGSFLRASSSQNSEGVQETSIKDKNITGGSAWQPKEGFELLEIRLGQGMPTSGRDV